MKKIALGFCFWLTAILLYTGCAPVVSSEPSINDTDNIYDSWAERPGFDIDEFYYQTWASAEGLDEPAWMYPIRSQLPHFNMPLVRCTDAEAATEACADKHYAARSDLFWAWLMADTNKETR